MATLFHNLTSGDGRYVLGTLGYILGTLVICIGLAWMGKERISRQLFMLAFFPLGVLHLMSTSWRNAAEWVRRDTINIPYRRVIGDDFNFYADQRTRQRALDERLVILARDWQSAIEWQEAARHPQSSTVPALYTGYGTHAPWHTPPVSLSNANKLVEERKTRFNEVRDLGRKLELDVKDQFVDYLPPKAA